MLTGAQTKKGKGSMEADCIIEIDELRQRIAELEAALVARAQPCVWREVNEGEYWSTTCKQDFAMFGGTPSENGYRFCPSCGCPLLEQAWIDADKAELQL